MDRCNLTITRLPNYAYLPAFFAEHGVHVVASLPHYREKGTDAQRGDGVFEESIEALRRAERGGLRRAGTGLQLDLVTNPVGTFLPGDQGALEAEWKRQMERLYGIASTGCTPSPTCPSAASWSFWTRAAGWTSTWSGW